MAYPNEEALLSLCKSFEEEDITLKAEFMGEMIPISDPNLVGNLFESIFYHKVKKKLDDFEEGPKQASPDYYGMDNYEFEQKAFTKSPNFDIGNFASYVNMLCQDGGVYKKLFKTKYLLFEYVVCNGIFKIKRFHYLSVHQLVGYSGKYPITMQTKRTEWYNIRPASVKNWYDPTKTPQLFIDRMIECIYQCPHMQDKLSKITNIKKQFAELEQAF